MIPSFLLQHSGLLKDNLSIYIWFTTAGHLEYSQHFFLWSECKNLLEFAKAFLKISCHNLYTHKPNCEWACFSFHIFVKSWYGHQVLSCGSVGYGMVSHQSCDFHVPDYQWSCEVELYFIYIYRLFAISFFIGCQFLFSWVTFSNTNKNLKSFFFFLI